MASQCSSCGGDDQLCLITAGDYSREPDPPAGRVLVYCSACREQRDATWFLSIIPIDVVDEELFVDLYRRGLTGSDPVIAAEVVFGVPRPDVASRALSASLDAGWPYLEPTRE